MSASDYIKYKRVGTQLRDVLPNSKKQAPVVFDDQMYIDFKQYTIENKIFDSKLIENSLIPTGSNLVFDMMKVVSSCPAFPICNDTHVRTNRVPMSEVYYNPQQPAKYVKQSIYGEPAHLNNPACDCIVNRKFSNSGYINTAVKYARYNTNNNVTPLHI
jgi:hypothetical protein